MKQANKQINKNSQNTQLNKTKKKKKQPHKQIAHCFHWQCWTILTGATQVAGMMLSLI